MTSCLPDRKVSDPEAVRLTTDCLICGANSWWLLPVPFTARSMLSDGRVIGESLEKATCSKCGLAQHAGFQHSRVRDLFGSDYSLSDHEPSVGFEAGRQKQYADWIQEAVQGRRFRTVLELGCGNGALLKELMAKYPESKFVGLEPSEQGVRWAQHAGLPVKRAYISGEDSVGGMRADLVVSVNVIEHTSQPIEFLRAARAALNPGGLVLIVCPDASVVGTELLIFDHFFSFCPTNLADLVRHADLEPINYRRSPSLLPGFQMMVAQSQSRERAGIEFNVEMTEPQAVHAGRVGHMAMWKQLDGRLSSAMSRFRSVAVFGAGEMAKLIHAYAPRSWDRVDRIVVDDPTETEFSGRPVIPYAELKATAGQMVLVAVSPHAAERISLRLKAAGHTTLSARDLLS